VQPENALKPIDVTPLGIEIEVSNAQFKYALSGMEVAVFGITITD
jgi:hypothetical protein